MWVGMSRDAGNCPKAQYLKCKRYRPILKLILGCCFEAQLLMLKLGSTSLCFTAKTV